MRWSILNPQGDHEAACYLTDYLVTLHTEVRGQAFMHEAFLPNLWGLKHNRDKQTIFDWILATDSWGIEEKW